jgi:hypothetical protein
MLCRLAGQFATSIASACHTPVRPINYHGVADYPPPQSCKPVASIAKKHNTHVNNLLQLYLRSRNKPTDCSARGLSQSAGIPGFGHIAFGEGDFNIEETSKNFSQEEFCRDRFAA